MPAGNNPNSVQSNDEKKFSVSILFKRVRINLLKTIYRSYLTLLKRKCLTLTKVIKKLCKN